MWRFSWIALGLLISDLERLVKYIMKAGIHLFIYFFMNRHQHWNNESGMYSGDMNKLLVNVFRRSKYLFVINKSYFLSWSALCLHIYKYLWVPWVYLWTSPCEHMSSSAVAAPFLDTKPVWTAVSCLTIGISISVFSSTAGSLHPIVAIPLSLCYTFCHEKQKIMECNQIICSSLAEELQKWKYFSL